MPLKSSQKKWSKWQKIGAILTTAVVVIGGVGTGFLQINSYRTEQLQQAQSWAASSAIAKDKIGDLEAEMDELKSQLQQERQERNQQYQFLIQQDMEIMRLMANQKNKNE